MNSSWIDLEASETDLDAHSEICVIGAGAAGLYLATALSRIGKDVILLEAGPSPTVYASEVDFVPVFLKNPYPGATVGRSFGMGGTTSRWGGLLVPHTGHNAIVSEPYKDVWNSILTRVERHASTVLSRLGYDSNPSFESFHESKFESESQIFNRTGIDIQSSLYLPFRRKNFLGLLTSVSYNLSPRVYFNAVSKDWDSIIDESCGFRIQRLVAVSRNGNRLTIQAKKYILASGAIESSRILLEIQRRYDDKAIKNTAAIGCYLSDHLSIPIADVRRVDFKKAILFFAPHFEGEWMRGFRFVLNKNNIRPLFFTHFIFGHEGSGYKLAKQIFGAFQQRSWPSISLTDIFQGAAGLSKIAFRRYLFKRLHIPSSTPIHFQLDMEQHRVLNNRVCLAPAMDNYGRHKAAIEWSISDHDIQSLSEKAERILTSWPGRKYGFPELIPRGINEDSNKPYDAYHPVGTCTMGVNAESVVDMNLKVWGIDNLWVVSTGVLPTAGTANPTFTMLCLAQHLVEDMT